MIDLDFKLQSSQKWSESAIDCYKRNMICEGCRNYEIFAGREENCQMKNVVLALYRKLGSPKIEDTV
jgi:hypothetical protein